MKQTAWVVLSFCIIFSVFISCRKEGPEGPAGVPGPAGPFGNANIRSYVFKSATTSTGEFTFTIPNLTKSFVDSCMISPGFQVSSVWYPVSGMGVNGAYDTRYLLTEENPGTNTYKVKVFLLQPGTALPYKMPVTWDRFRIIFATANSIIYVD